MLVMSILCLSYDIWLDTFCHVHHRMNCTNSGDNLTFHHSTIIRSSFEFVKYFGLLLHTCKTTYVPFSLSFVWGNLANVEAEVTLN